VRDGSILMDDDRRLLLRVRGYDEFVEELSNLKKYKI